MSLRKQVLLAGVAVVLIAGIAIVLLSWFVLDQNLRRIEVWHARTDLQRVRNAVEDEIASLDTTARDYAHWDTTYKFAGGEDPDFLRREFLDVSMENLRIDHVLIIDNTGKLFAFRQHRLQQQRSISAGELLHLTEPITALLTRSGSDPALRGIQRTSAGVYLYAIRPILTSEQKGPSHGWLVMTRCFDGPAVERLGKSLDLPISFVDPDMQTRNHESQPDAVEFVDIDGTENRNVRAELSLKDINGHYAGTLVTITPAVVLEQGKRAQTFLISALFGISLLAGFSTLIWLERTVLYPIVELSGTAKLVSETDDLTKRAPVFGRGRNELALLATRFNLMLDRLQRSRDELTKARISLEHEATHDGLTGVLNKVAFRKLLHNELARARRDRTSLALMMIDVDFFKRVNDSYGHEAGDQVLKTVVRELQQCLRSYDALGRSGGDEFAVVAPGCSLEEAHSIAKRMREYVAQAATHFGKELVSVTLSIGVASGWQASELELVRQADAALYEAKRQGRNCVALGPQPLHLLASEHPHATVN